MMELRHLSTFRAVVATGSFTRAAAVLGYAQSSVTAHIQALESELGVPLFDRLGKQVLLTAAGRSFSDYATRLLDLADEARTAVADPAAPAGTLTISAPESLCTYRLPAVLRAMRDRWPAVRVVFRSHRVEQLRRHVREGELDLAFVLEPPQPTAGLVVEPLNSEPIVLVGPPAHPLACAPAVHPADLAGVTMLLSGVGCAYRALFEEAITAAGVALRDILEFSSVEAIKQCVIADMGLAILPAITVQRERAQGSLAILPWAGPDLTVITQLVYHADKWQSPALRAFIQTAHACLST